MEEIIGQGGMGKVYKATDVSKKQSVAIKHVTVFSKDPGASELIARFRQEYHFLANIDHPNIIKAYDLLELSGDTGAFSQDSKVAHATSHLFLVMELVSGILFHDFLTLLGDISLLEKLAIAEQMSRAVEVVNNLGIIHRDIKPANIIVEKNTKQIKLLDLGIAKSTRKTHSNSKLTQPGTVLGTPGYMSPEQINGEIANNSDVFSLGVVLYQFFLTMPDSPFDTREPISTMDQVCHKNLPPLTTLLSFSPTGIEKKVYTKLSQVVARSLAKESVARLSAGELADSLQDLYSFLQKNQSSDKSHLWTPTLRLKASPIKNIEKTKYSPSKNLNKVLTIVCLLLTILVLVLWLQLSKSNKTEQQLHQKLKQNLQKLKSTQKELKKLRFEKRQTMPIEFPRNLWQLCWSGRWMDFTNKAWLKLTSKKQNTYIKAYQKWYAHRENTVVKKTVEKDKITMILIPPGRFWQGAPKYEIIQNKREMPRHRVIISKAFWISETEITQSQWQAITRYAYKGTGAKPKANVSWHEINDKFLSSLGKQYSLPTEAQWEYACKAGGMSRYYWGKEINEKYMWYSQNAKKKAWPVKQKLANAFGLYDMAGNLWEWCYDWYGAYSLEDLSDPKGAKIGIKRVVRGGSYQDDINCRSSYRISIDPTVQKATIGFRITKTFKQLQPQ